MTSTFTVPKTIKTTGDVTDKLMSWIDGLPNGTKPKPVDVSFARKQFQVEGTLTLTDRQHIRFRDGGTYAKTVGDSHRAGWRAVGGGSLRWLNVKVVGPRARFASFDSGRQWQHGFDFQGVSGYELAACTIQGVLGDGVCNQRDPRNADWTEGCVILPTCRFDGTGRMTVSFTAARSIMVGAITITDPTLSLFDIEPNGAGWGAEGILIDGAKVSGTNPAHTFTLLYIADFGGAGSTVSDITVRNTVQVGNSVVVAVKPPAATRHRNIVVTNNISSVRQSAWMEYHGVDGLTVAGNDVDPANITVQDCTGVTS